MARGRKRIDPENGKATRKLLTLDELTIRKLKVIGDGNLSQGARIAAQIAYERYQRSA